MEGQDGKLLVMAARGGVLRGRRTVPSRWRIGRGVWLATSLYTYEQYQVSEGFEEKGLLEVDSGDWTNFISFMA